MSAHGGETYDERRECVETYEVSNKGAEERGDDEGDRSERVDCCRFDDGLHDGEVTDEVEYGA